ncbi:fumarylacetoacetate hydrolase family protein [Sinorhizobium sp. BG8]|uniref:2-keto-4-pentenoate hydratase n=1 Tax=Sinorhizobium sp. BG8 TaxID=2613773 RepID=UPI00193D3CE8|nr:fumarylacetoacetate hydrolase family protein [Sinorhizobium sp. BG8]QRM55274.1 hydratase [Sinorhizobium sp. BG8]
MTPPSANLRSIATEVVTLLGTGRQTSPFSTRDQDFGLAEAYGVTRLVRELREQRGECMVGRKIGFTNRTIWPQYNVYAPIWGYMYDRTVFDLDALTEGYPIDGLPEPRIEPEILFHLAKAPMPGMSESDLLGCIDWIAHGFELVQSLFPGWKFAPADTIAAFGLHGAYVMGPRHMIGQQPEAWLKALSTFETELHCNGTPVARGHASDVLGGPLSALKHLNDLLAQDTINPPLAAGEIVTTGTLTSAMPVARGERWSTTLSGLDLSGISVSLI